MDDRGARFILTACSRCCGDLVLERDRWGERYFCLQCGSEEADPLRQRPRQVQTATRSRFRLDVWASPTLNHASTR